jgi:cell division protein FtsI (penicillin-binding protein 3)
VSFPGPYTWDQVAPLRELRGVYLERRLQRFYPRGALAQRLVGRVDARGRGGSGLERALDSVLAGRAGSAVMLRDLRGRRYPSPSRPTAEPVDGGDVVLTIDAELQEIAERSLARAAQETRASGADVVILHPRTGEVLALASVRRGSSGAAGAIGDTYEPGSTAKVFTAAALLRAGKATPADTVDVEQGTWTLGRRTIHDTHRAGLLSLADVIRLSSNIGIAKLGQRLTAVEQYEALRDFGFGTPTGIEFPGEAAGRLRHPRQWTVESPASLAMGYELAVTPLQLAAAYGTFATGGVLLEPTLVREARDADGRVRWRHGVRPVRRVLSAETAEQLAHMLLGVVEEGTGQRAALGTYALAGKTGTARRAVQGRYEEGRYTASFVGLFPAVDPQLVLLVKIDDPEGEYFGGTTAAPVVRTILEAALATPAVTLDRTRLSRRRAPAAAEAAPAAIAPGAVVVAWPQPPAAPDSTVARPVPDVAGQDLRAASRALHRAGFRVRVEGWGAVETTRPAAGTVAPAGTMVVLRAGGDGAR